LLPRRKSPVRYAASDMRVMIYDLMRDGVKTCSDIAEEPGTTNGMVSRYAMDFSQTGVMKKHGKGYVLAQPKN
jgi:hypothetical protein